MRIFLYFFFCVFLCACANKNLGHYASLKIEQNISILSHFTPSFTQIKAMDYKKHFFSAWNLDENDFDEREIFWAFEGYLKKQYYFFNKQIIPKEFFKKAILNANTKAFLSLKQKAIITQNTPLRNLPTSTAILSKPFKHGEGIPFDYSLDNVLNVASPVLISHYTQDKRYAFVKSEAGWGFVKASHLRILSNLQAKNYEKASFITPLFERMLVYDENDFVFEARIGAIYPYNELKNGLYYTNIAGLKFQIPQSKAAPFPLELNDERLKSQMKELINRPYGWGGYDDERDCSSLIRDIYAPFGLYLPRNSKAQSMALERFDISTLNNTQKAELIKNYAKPYETLLYLKGHIMLYVGHLNGENLAFHSIWGVRTKNDERILISKSIISTLEIAKDDKRVAKEDLLLSRLESLSFFYLTPQERYRLEKALKKSDFIFHRF